MKAVQEGYSSFIMQHQFPLFVLKLSLDPASMDVNVHPSKMEVNFENPSLIYKEVYHAIRNRLLELNTSDVIEIKYEEDPVTEDEIKNERSSLTEIKEEKEPVSDKKNSDHSKYEDMDLTFTQSLMKMGKEGDYKTSTFHNLAQRKETGDGIIESELLVGRKEESDSLSPDEVLQESKIISTDAMIREEQEMYSVKEPVIRIIGQAFKTYVIAEIDDKLYIVDQHAAHEKINFERLIKSMDSENYAQQLLKPVVLQLTAREELTITKYMDVFTSLGFEIEHFGGSSYTVRAVPMSFYRMEIDSLFIELLDHLSTVSDAGNIELIKDKIANVACKSSIKAGHIMSMIESEHLIRELLKLDAPFNCPHGRPTMIAMSKYELEKKFKRVV